MDTKKDYYVINFNNYSVICNYVISKFIIGEEKIMIHKYESLPNNKIINSLFNKTPIIENIKKIYVNDCKFTRNFTKKPPHIKNIHIDDEISVWDLYSDNNSKFTLKFNKITGCIELETFEHLNYC